VQYPSALLNNGEKQEVLFNLYYGPCILLKILLLHKDAVEIINSSDIYSKCLVIISACWSFIDAVHFLCNIVYDIYFNLNYETGSAASEESSLQKA